MYRVFATFYSFVILGANDGAYGALIPYLETYYNVNYTVISLIFLSPVGGYIASALLNNRVHMMAGQRGVAMIMSVSHLIAYTVICLHPPYPVIVVVFILAGFGNGLGDAAWNAWVGDMANPNEILGFLHAFYGLGATISPLVATTVIVKAGWKWYQFYYLMVGASLLEVLFLVGTFWQATGAQYRAVHSVTEDQESGNNSGTSTPHNLLTTPGDDESRLNQETQHRLPPTSRVKSEIPWYTRINPFANPNSRTAQAIKNRVTILASVFLLFYVGIEVSLGGWVVTFMLRVRHGTQFASGLTSMGFWLGVTVGRLVLGFVTARLFPTEKHAVATYLVLCIGLQLLFWLVPSFMVSAVMIGLLGFFIGPLFPAAIVALTKLLPKRLHVAAVGFAAALGASGATILPFAVGAIANVKGVRVLQPIVLALFAVTFVVWISIPRLPKQRMA